MIEKQKKNWPKALSEIINMVTTIAAAVALGLIGGHWLDKKLGTGPWLMVIGVLLGVAAGIKGMWEKLNKNI